MNVVRATESGRNEVVDLVSIRLSGPYSVLVKHLALERDRDSFVVHARLPAYLSVTDQNSGARSETRIGNRHGNQACRLPPRLTAINQGSDSRHHQNRGGQRPTLPPGGALSHSEL